MNIILNLAYLKKGYAMEIELKKDFQHRAAQLGIKYRTLSTMFKNDSKLLVRKTLLAGDN